MQLCTFISSFSDDILSSSEAKNQFFLPWKNFDFLNPEIKKYITAFFIKGDNKKNIRRAISWH